MSNKADLRRRWAGAFFLGVSLLMLIAGESILEARLKGSAWLTILYWTACFVAVMSAVVIALRDISIVRRRTRTEARQLMTETLNEITHEKEARAKHPGRNSNAE